MKYQIDGTLMQTPNIALENGETSFSQTHTLAWVNDRITMDTHAGGGLMTGLMRSLRGGGIFITDFTAGGKGEIWQQGMPIINLAEEIARHLPSK